MAHKRLSAQEVQELKSMVQQGVSPEDISRHFGVAISSVHNYKKRFKEAGVKFPSVKGKRPVGTIEPATNAGKVVGQVVSQTSQAKQNYQFVVNGVTVQVSGEAKNINIGKSSMEITF